MLGNGRIGGWATGFLGVLVAVALPAQAQKMYTGSWVAESFGNDLYTGSGESNYFSVFGMPQGVQCNPAQPRCAFASTPVNSKGNFSALGSICTPVSKFGGGVRPAKGATAKTGMGLPKATTPRYRNPAFFTSGGAPNTTSCTAYSTVSGSPADFALTTNDPLRGYVMKGAPLTGGGSAATTTGGAFKLAAGDLARTTVGEFNNIPPYLYSYTYASLSNDAGSFGPGGGPGSFSIVYNVGKAQVANVVVKKGPNKFGGVMKLLGKLTTKVCYFRNGGCSLGGNNWRYDAIGAKAYTSGGVVTAGYIATYTAMYYNTALMQTSTVLASGGRFSWTTGSVTLTATGRGPHKTIERRKGFDSRTSGGAGKIQLVSPIITRWLQPASNFETGGIAILKLEFAPEPGAWAMLAGGLSLLLVLFRARGR
jgi:hypothetical protein